MNINDSDNRYPGYPVGNIDDNESHNKGVTGKTADYNEDVLVRLINSIPGEDLRSLILMLSEKFPEVNNFITEKYSDTIESNELQKMEKELKAIKPTFTYNKGVYNNGTYNKRFEDLSEEYAQKLTIFIEKNVGNLISHERYESASNLLVDVYQAMDDCYKYDYFGVLNDVIRACLEYWSVIMQRCPANIRDKLCIQLNKMRYEAIKSNDLDIYIICFISSQYNAKAYLQGRLLILDNKIAKYWDISNKTARQLCDEIMHTLGLMSNAGFTQNEMDQAIRDNWEIPIVKEELIARLRNSDKPQKALELLIEFRESDKDHKTYSYFETIAIVDLCQKIGKLDDYKRELAYLIFNYPDRVNVYDNILKLKHICSNEEWLSYREQILNDSRFSRIQSDLMYDEGMYERLLESIIQSNSVQDMDKYERKLKPLYPDQMKQFYASYVITQTALISTRLKYNELFQYLIKIETYPDGLHTAMETADKLKEQYPHKPALLDELYRAGF